MKAIASTRDAIITKFHGSTATRGPRISATISATRVYHDYDHSMNLYSNHVAALETLCVRHGLSQAWDGTDACWIGAWTGNKSMTWVATLT
jgi:hypothetical protein